MKWIATIARDPWSRAPPGAVACVECPAHRTTPGGDPAPCTRSIRGPSPMLMATASAIWPASGSTSTTSPGWASTPSGCRRSFAHRWPTSATTWPTTATSTRCSATWPPSTRSSRRPTTGASASSSTSSPTTPRTSTRGSSPPVRPATIRSGTGTSGETAAARRSPRTTGEGPSWRTAGPGPGMPTPSSGTCTSSSPSNPTSTGTTPRWSRPSTGSCASGSTAAWTASASTSSTASDVTLPSRTTCRRGPRCPTARPTSTRRPTRTSGPCAGSPTPIAGDRVLIGETALPGTQWIAPYYGNGDELHLAFNFGATHTAWDAAAWRRRMDRITALLGPRGAWPTWVFSNHDFPRHRTRLGGSEARARAAAVILLTQRGTPFVYAGEELGLEDAVVPDDRVVDPGGRDGCRAPLPWTEAAPHGWGPDPWLPVPSRPGRPVRRGPARRSGLDPAPVPALAAGSPRQPGAVRRRPGGARRARGRGRVAALQRGWRRSGRCW